ncbi:P-loop containing nucleoside triphosphate hydrolase protein [Russula earlei]|uniref:P-loop containing nucleoside triphosphate hydrolase protein n=1 Tax=Russula earlei TaxID=71964 RepID=A0ACC0TX18_9AGAM|nr:P-loop containing nucleoside triphosphate hydrolase protein [Russula earlei]
MPGDILKKRKIAVLGSRSVGKSSLVIQFTENQFIESYYPTIENTFTKSVNYKGVDYDCDIIDTAGQVRIYTPRGPLSLLPCPTGQDEFSILNSKHAIGIHGFVLVYSVTSRNSFDMIQIIYDKIINFCGIKEIPCVIVGSKIDLSQRITRQVSPGEGEDLAKANHAAWIETSAKKDINVAQVFELCLAEIERQAPTKAEPQPNRCLIM